MFNPLRLIRRKDYIDDTAAAFIEGRATEREQAELRGRATREPGLMEDLESVRQTVSLLRSVETVRAPRSFALAEAPQQARVSRPRIAMAPAAFAIAAAAMVGLLAVGNLANVVRQSDGNPAPRDTAALTAESQSEEMMSALAGTETDRSFAQSTATPAVFPTPAPTSVTAAPTSESTTSALIAPDDGAPAPAGTAGTLEPMTGGSAPGQGEGAAGATPAAAGSTLEATVPDSALALPEATVPGQFDASGAERRSEGAAPAPSVDQEQPRDKGGIVLPLWQLQVAFASLAVVMAGAWFLLHRRLTA